MILIASLNILVAKTHPRSKYFPTTPDGKLTKDPPRSQNHLRLDNLTIFPDGSIEGAPKWLNAKDARDPVNGIIQLWVEKAIVALFSYDYKNYRISISNLRDLFTPKGFQQFKVALLESRNVETVKREKSVVYVNVLSPPRLIKEKIVPGSEDGERPDIRGWQYITPIEVVFQSTEKRHSLYLLSKIVVIRESILVQDFFGLKIATINFKTMPPPEGLDNEESEQ